MDPCIRRKTITKAAAGAGKYGEELEQKNETESACMAISAN